VNVLTAEHAKYQYEALNQAAMDSVVIQVRAQLSNQAREWRRAADELAGLDEEDYGIELLCAVLPGMWVQDDRGDAKVIRLLENGGQCSLHVERPDSSNLVYLNYAGKTSPVIIRTVKLRAMTEPVESTTEESL
jgi:hypothetical protein